MAFGNFDRNDDPEKWSQKVRDIMDEMLKRSFVPFRDPGAWQPATNVYETRDFYYICVELSGVSREHIDVEVLEKSRVFVRGVRSQPRPKAAEGPLSVHVLEIDEGAFARQIDLPERVDDARIEATYDEGYLWITIPKSHPR